MFKFLNRKKANEYMNGLAIYLEDNYAETFNRIIPPMDSDEEIAKSNSTIRFSRAVMPQEDRGVKFSLKEPRVMFEAGNVVDTLLLNMSFVERMRAYIREKNLIESRVYKVARIDRRLFSKILSDSEYKPSKDTCIALCVGLQLDLEQANDMLSRAGYVLSHSIKRDVIIEYCLKQKISDVDIINEVLYRYEEKTLGR